MIEQDHAAPGGDATFGSFGTGLDGDSLFRSAEAGAGGATTHDNSTGERSDGSDEPRRKKSSRRRGGRRRKSSAKQEGGEDAESRVESRAEAGAATTPEAPAEGTAEGGAPKKKRRRSRRRKPAGARTDDADDADVAEDRAEADEPENARDTGRGGRGSDDGDDDEPKRKKKRRSRRKSKRSDDEDRAEGDDAPSATRAADDDRDEDDDADDKPKRRRRGSRGGRKRKKKDESASGAGEGPAVIEAIPGEEDDLPELPDLPDDAELVESGSSRSKRGRKKSKRSRGKTKAKADEDDDPPARKKAAKPRTQMILVNSSDREEARVAVVEGGKLIDLQINAATDQNLVSDVYRGRVVNIEASIGAAFIDFGRGRNGFLHTSDVLPDYGEKDWKLEKLLSTHVDPEDWDERSSQPHIAEEVIAGDEEDDDVDDGDDSGDDAKGSKSKKKRGKKKASRMRRRPRTPITDLLKVGQRVAVQVTKDAIGDKGPTLTTYLSIPGRYLVLMPSMQHTGVSRKIEDPKERKRLKRALDSFAPKGMGVIARTAASGRTKAELKRDLDYLLGAWERFSHKLSVGHGPTALYRESDVAIKTVRDLFGPETDAVIVDDEEAYKSIKEFAERLMPDQVDRIKLHDGSRPLFHHYGVEQDYEKVFSRRIELPSGGSIVIDQAEALVAIDVNSGKTRTESHDFEEIALKTNLEAVPEIARQIRLRDLGGILVIDFIDMMRRANMRTVEKAFREAFTGDRARSKLGRISQFGLLEMTRQRLGPGVGKRLFVPCPSCRGAGKIRTVQSRAAAILRRLGSSLTLKGFSQVEVRAHPDAIRYLKEHHQDDLKALEDQHNRKLKLSEVPDQIEDSVLRYLRADGREVRPGGRRKR